VTSKLDFKVMVLLLVFMQLTRDLFAIAKFLFYFSITFACTFWPRWQSENGSVCHLLESIVVQQTSLADNDILRSNRSSIKYLRQDTYNEDVYRNRLQARSGNVLASSSSDGVTDRS